MQFGGLRSYHEQRRALAEARNVADLRQLEGPGTEQRLSIRQRRFRRLREAGVGSPLWLPLACAMVFAAVLIGGLVLDWVF